jgi:hypothetical protein
LNAFPLPRRALASVRCLAQERTSSTVTDQAHRNIRTHGDEIDVRACVAA